jgi:hypothetical protein
MGRGASEEPLAAEATGAETRSDALVRARREAEEAVIAAARIVEEQVGPGSWEPEFQDGRWTRLREALNRHEQILRELRGEQPAPVNVLARSTPYTLSPAIAFRVLDVLRLAHIYALKDAHPDELAPDFNPHKWAGHEVEFAQESVDAYRALIDELKAQTPDDDAKQ